VIEAVWRDNLVPTGNAARSGPRRRVGRARDALGEAAFTAAWAEGEAMSLEQAVACALDFGVP
jgi:hypothetical protein